MDVALGAATILVILPLEHVIPVMTIMIGIVRELLMLMEQVAQKQSQLI